MIKTYKFGQYKSTVHIQKELPSLDGIIDDLSTDTNVKPAFCLIVCDVNTEKNAREISGGKTAVCVLPAGEKTKCWNSIETILRTAKEASLGRDAFFIGVGGGVITDVCAFAASLYMRGVGLVLVPTTLLAMADAAVGGKTGIDLFNVKNSAGSFYPARHIYMPVSVLSSLPLREWKSGLAEIIKAAVLDNSIEKPSVYAHYIAVNDMLENNDFSNEAMDAIITILKQAVSFKCRIVEADPKETSGKRALLNLGHTFAHALESSAGLGLLSHGEAVAWGMVCACKLGILVNVTPPRSADRICALITALSYQTAQPHPAMSDTEEFMKALRGDKKKKSGLLNFIIPAKKSAVSYKIDEDKISLIQDIVNGKI